MADSATMVNNNLSSTPSIVSPSIVSPSIVSPSICIPRIDKTISSKDIINIFKDINIGDVSKIDVIEYVARDKQMYNRCFIHFKSWSNIAYRDIVLSGGYFKIIYRFPWFWKCYMSKIPRPSNSRPSNSRPSNSRPSNSRM